MSWKPQLAKRPLEAHKGDFGRIGIVAGSVGMMGAAIMSAKAALRCGAGVVYLFTVESAAGEVNVALPEVVVKPLPETDGALGLDALGPILTGAEEHGLKAIGIGPGLGRAECTQQLVVDLLAIGVGRERPFVVDADGLYPLSVNQLEAFAENTVVVTPHGGEFARLFEASPGGDEERIKAAEVAADRANQVVVLKGAGTVVAALNHETYVNETGNPGMATAGAGDVLMGMVTAFIGQGLSSVEAAKTAVYCHGLAGDLASNTLGEYSMMATDIIDKIPDALRQVEALA